MIGAVRWDFLLLMAGFWAAAGALAAGPFAAWLVLRHGDRRRRMATALTTVGLGAVGGVAYWLDQWWGLSASWWFVGIALALACVVAVPVAIRLRSWPCGVAGAAFLVALLAMHVMDLMPVKPHRRFFAAIAEGMTEAEVRAALRREFPDDGPFAIPVLRRDADRSCYFLDPGDPAYNAEAVSVTFRAGRVESKHYLRD